MPKRPVLQARDFSHQRINHQGIFMNAPFETPVSYRFTVGDMVRLTKMLPIRNAVSGPYEILAQLPVRDGELQYRVKSEREPYQRILKEDELELV